MVSNKRVRNVFLTVGASFVFATLAIWQFYQYVTFRGPEGAVDLQGGHLRFWLAIGLGLIACVIAFWSFSVWMRYDRGDEMHITSQGF